MPAKLAHRLTKEEHEKLMKEIMGDAHYVQCIQEVVRAVVEWAELEPEKFKRSRVAVPQRGVFAIGPLSSLPTSNAEGREFVEYVDAKTRHEMTVMHFAFAMYSLDLVPERSGTDEEFELAVNFLTNTPSRVSTICAHCALASEYTTNTSEGGDGTPRPGAFLVCLGCYEVSVFVSGEETRKLTPAEFQALPEDIQTKLVVMKNMRESDKKTVS